MCSTFKPFLHLQNDVKINDFLYEIIDLLNHVVDNDVTIDLFLERLHVSIKKYGNKNNTQ